MPADVQYQVVVDSSDASTRPASPGQDLSQAPEIGVREPLARGELVEVLPQYRPGPDAPSRCFTRIAATYRRRVRVFMDSMAAILGPVLLH